MTTTTEQALVAALNIAADDKISWTAGYSAFNKAIMDGSSINQAIAEALDATCCDQEKWISAFEEFYSLMGWNESKREGTIERMKRRLHNLISSPSTPQAPASDADENQEVQETPGEVEIEEEVLPEEDLQETQTEEKREKTSKKAWGWLLALVVVMALAIGINSHWNDKIPTPSPTPTPTVTEHTTWKMVEGDYGSQSRWMSDGVAEIKAAKTEKEAREAASVWLERVKTDPNLLVGAVKFFLNKDVDKASLVDKDNYATDQAVQLTAELQLALGTAKTITAEPAPKDGFNSGVNDKQVVQAKKAGITGDRKAVKILLDNGNELWIMSRCGNVVSKKPTDNIPDGDTDNPPKPPQPKPIKTPTPIVEKDPTKDVLVNPDVADWKKDDPSEPLHTVTNDDGAKVSNGLQEQPWVDAKEAKQKAVHQNRVDHESAQAEAITSGAGIVDSNQSHIQTTSPSW